MRSTSALASLLLAGALGLLVLAPLASVRADVVPPDQCTEVGSACTLPSGGPGLCRAHTCTRILYGPNGPTPSSYDCGRCEAPSVLDAPSIDPGGSLSGGGLGLGLTELAILCACCGFPLVVGLGAAGVFLMRRKRAG